MNKFSYESMQIVKNGNKMKRFTVKVHNSKGVKRMEEYNGRKKIANKTFKLDRQEIKNIKERKFMPGLWRPCINACNVQKLMRDI
jgi:hypothetical protein